MAVLNNPKISLSSLIENRDRKNWIEPVKEVKIEKGNTENTQTNKISLLSMRKNQTPVSQEMKPIIEEVEVVELKQSELTEAEKPKIWISLKAKITEKSLVSDSQVSWVDLPVDSVTIIQWEIKQESKLDETKVETFIVKNEEIKLEEDKKVEELLPQQNPVIKEKVQEKTDSVIIWWKVLVRDPDWLFTNYKSEFENKENAVLAQIKKLKNLPKTRPLFVASLIWLLVFGLIGLYFINPEKNNLKYYKASIVWNVKNVIWEIGISEITSTWIVNNPNSWASVQTISEKVEIKEERKKEEIIKWGYKIIFESKADASWKKIYRYNWEEFFDTISLDKKFSQLLDQSKEDKVRNYLLNKWG